MALARKTLNLRKNLKEEQRREQLKQAAVSVFSAKGYQSATLDDLVMEAGVSKSLLYWYWESKSALLTEMIDSCTEPYKALLREALDSKEPFPEKFDKVLSDYLALFRENNRLNRLVHFCSLHSSNKPGENFGEKVNAHYKDVLGLLEALLAQGRDSGVFRKDLDAASSAMSLLSLIEGHIYLSILEERIPLERMLLPLYASTKATEET